MSQWHRAHPELVGTDADPWMAHESYRKLVPIPESERERLREERDICPKCGRPLRVHPRRQAWRFKESEVTDCTGCRERTEDE